ncbi:uncharacterized protein LOC131665948 isoform X2 [Phymastichus coffea]|uniref:uncharacterized protein LOC131665948 isoform X2 n=1 Tax=Phymastichus coffea TaxID=108790 RepID=UPI00273B21B7|nr:uncharacterized protein LOC131665948 isoform X2 [Phymastichus coffea]
MPGGPTAAAAHAMRPAELQMDPRSLPTYQPATTPQAASSSASTQVDVSTQVDLHEGASLQRGATPLYSREDIKEQYCITNRQLDAVEKSGGGIFGCLTSRGPSPCSSAAKASILSACVRSAPSDENLCDAPYPYPYPSPHPLAPRAHPRQMPPLIMYQQPYSTYPRHMSARRPKSFYSGPDPKRYVWVPEDEEPTKLEGPRSVLPPSMQQQQPLISALHSQQKQQQQSQQQPPLTKGKHVSFARSQTLTSFDMPRTKSPPRPHNQERLIDSQPTVHTSMASTLSKTHPAYPPPEPRIVVLEKQPKRGTMKAQATQTELPAGIRGRLPPVTLSPRTIHRVKMVSQGAQTNGMLNGRKLHKSYSEAGKLSTPHGIGSVKEEPAEHEPLQRTQSEEPPRSPFILDTPPRSPTVAKDELLNGDLAQELANKELELDDEEILIDFKPAPVSPDARALLEEMAQPYRRYVSLQKTLSDGEIQVERRELMSEIGEPSYPHTCRRNHPQDPWSKKLHAPVQFSSTPEDLSLLRVISPPDDHNDEEFHENLVRRGLFRKRSVSLEDGVQILSTNEYILPRSLPTSPTSPTSAAAPSRMSRETRDGGTHQRHLLHAGFVAPSPFASSDSLTNDATRDHSDGIWNESQATVLQADERTGGAGGLLTPSSKRRQLLILQHQQRSSMDTDALDAEDEMDVYPSSPRIRLEAPTPVTTTPTAEATYSITNGRTRMGYLRRSPCPAASSQPHSQSSSEFGLSRSGTTDISETSTTDDYITANTSTGTGTTTGTATSSLGRPTGHMHKAPSGPISATATQADGSSFESASSVYSLARSEAVLDHELSSPRALKSNSPYSVQQQQQQQQQPSPTRSSSSSSSGSYDLEDAMPDNAQETFKAAAHGAQTATNEQEIYDGHRSSSGGYAESPPDPQFWNEEERRRRKKTFTLDFPAGLEPTDGAKSTADAPAHPASGHGDAASTSLSPNHRERYRSRSKSAAARSSPHRNSKRRSFDSTTLAQQQQQQQQQMARSPQKEEWREQGDEQAHAPTSDDSSCSHPSCSHHYHVHHHHPHHHVHREAATESRHRRTRDSPRRKSAGHLPARRRGSRDEDKNAALTGSLPRRRSRAVDHVSSSRLSPGGGGGGGRYSASPGRSNGAQYSTALIKSPSPEVRLKALSAESLRSVSPGSDSVFYGIDDSTTDQAHCHCCGREVSADIVQPPAGFADSPEGGHRQTSKHTAGHRLFKKFDKRYRSEDRSERRYHSSSTGRSDLRARSEERGVGTGSRYGEDFSRERFHTTRSTDASMEILTGREDEDAYTEPYTSYEWLYISDFEESCAWRRPDTAEDDDDEERRGAQECTESEKKFKKKYQAATHRVYLHNIYWKSTGEMFKRVQSKAFKSDKKVVVRRKAGGEFGFRIHGSKPVMISAIEPDTPAENSGVGVGDIVVSVNGKSVLEAVHSEVVRLAQSNPDELELEVASTSNVVAPHLGRDGPPETKQEPALYSGYLWRKSMSTSARDKWMRRWFALRRNNCLYFYKTDMDSQPVGAVMLLKYVVELTHESRAHSFAISKYGAPTLHLAADTDELAARWCSVIREAVERNNQADTWLEGSLRLQNLPANVIQRPHCYGYLSKQHERARRASSPTGWSRRYCVLRDAVMYFYEDAGSERAFGVACLQGYRVLNSASSSGGRKHAFELQPPDPTQRTYTFACDSEMDKKRWLAALEYSIDRWIKIG